MNIENIVRTARGIKWQFSDRHAILYHDDSYCIQYHGNRTFSKYFVKHNWRYPPEISIDLLVLLYGRMPIWEDGHVRMQMSVRQESLPKYVAPLKNRYGEGIYKPYHSAKEFFGLTEYHAQKLFRRNALEYPRRLYTRFSQEITGDIISYVLLKFVETGDVEWDQVWMANVGERLTHIADGRKYQ